MRVRNTRTHVETLNRAKTGFGDIEGDQGAAVPWFTRVLSYQCWSIFLPSLRVIRGVGERTWSKEDGGDVRALPCHWPVRPARRCELLVAHSVLSTHSRNAALVCALAPLKRMWKGDRKWRFTRHVKAVDSRTTLFKWKAE